MREEQLRPGIRIQLFTITIAHHYRVNTTRLTHAESYGVRRTVEGAFNLDSGNRDGKRGPVVVKRTDQYATTTHDLCEL